MRMVKPFSHGRSAALATLLLLVPAPAGSVGDQPFEDGLFRRCIAWLLSGEGGGLIENLCIANYQLPTPSLFQCARKTLSGFGSETEREVCAVIFDEQARKVRSAPLR